MPQLRFKLKNKNVRMGIENKSKHWGQKRIIDEYQMCLNSSVLLLSLVTK